MLHVSDQIFISGTLAGMNKSASVTAMTSATVTPGAVSCSVILPPEKPITAISVTTRSTGREDVSGSAHFCDDLGFPFRGVLHGDDDALCPGHQVHRAAHPRHHLAGNHPVGEVSFGVDLKAAEDRYVDVTAPDQSERHRAVEDACARQGTDRPSAGIGKQGVGHALLRNGSGADQSVLRLKKYLEIGRNEVCDQRRNSDAEIDEVTCAKFACNPSRDDRLSIHGSPVGDEVVDERRGRYDMVGRNDADRERCSPR